VFVFVFVFVCVCMCALLMGDTANTAHVEEEVAADEACGVSLERSLLRHLF